MNNYFYIQPINISINTPFDYQNVRAISWIATQISRGGTLPSIFKCDLLDYNLNSIYTWDINIPQDIIDQWLDDSVIDNYICSTDSRLVKVV